MQDFINALKELSLSSENPDFKASNESWHICRKNTRLWLRDFKSKLVRDILLNTFKEDGFYSAGYFPEDMDFVEDFILKSVGGIVTRNGVFTVIEAVEFVFVITNCEGYYKRLIILSHKEF